MPNNLYIIGAGGLGREMVSTLSFFKKELNIDVIGFVDDDQPAGRVIDGLKVLGGIDYLESIDSASVLIGVGNPTIREEIYLDPGKQHVSFPSIIHPRASIHSSEFVNCNN